MKCRKKPTVIDGTQWFKLGDHPKVTKFHIHKGKYDSQPCGYCQKEIKLHGWISTMEGGHIVCPSDWVMTGVKGENWPVKEDIFKETYEIVE